jgi:hypothetical protein
LGQEGVTSRIAAKVVRVVVATQKLHEATCGVGVCAYIDPLYALAAYVTRFGDNSFVSGSPEKKQKVG